MKTTIVAASPHDAPEAASLPDAPGLEDMRELLSDLRDSIRTQRRLIDKSRALLDRS